MKIKKILLCTLAVGVIGACSNKKEKAEDPSAGIRLENLDTSIDPSKDFYKFACGGWMKNNPLKAEYARYGSFDAIGENNKVRLKGLIEEISKKANPQGSIGQKIADLYNQSMDSTRRNKEAYKPIVPILKKIDQIKNKKDFIKTTFELQRQGAVSGFFYIYADVDDKNSSKNIIKTRQGGLSLDSKDYYINDDKKSKDIRSKYLQHITNMFVLCGFSKHDAQNNANIVLNLETKIAKASSSKLELRDPYANYNLMSLAEIKKLTPSIDWKLILNTLNVNVKELSISQKKQMEEVNNLFANEKLSNLKTLLKWQTINDAASLLSDEIYNESFDFNSRYMQGKEVAPERWKRGINVVNHGLGMAVGKMYVEKYFPSSAKKRMLELVHNLQKSLAQRINDQEWMSDETKKKAIDKLNSYYIKIGYPDKWKDYSALEINKEDSFYSNLLKISEFESDYNLAKAGLDVDKSEWAMTPQTVNAYYNSTTNEICFPAGILQYPFFDMNADDAFNYGAIGVVIGHEMTHGFDDKGSLYDKNGNLNEWWTETDRANFKARTKVMANYFNQFIVAPGVHANGEFTLGENIADHGGLGVSFQAFKTATKDNPLPKKLGFTAEQRFFLAYANVWANNIRPKEILKRTKIDPHSLGELRVNGALPQIGPWYKAFNITKESPMYIDPKDRVHVW